MRVADRVFAPHYAAPLPRAVLVATGIAVERDGDVIGELAPGDTFEVLELTASHAWGVAANGAVGYVPLTALAAS